MNTLLALTIGEIMTEHPDRYLKDKYNTSFKQFKVLQDALLFDFGVQNTIERSTPLKQFYTVYIDLEWQVTYKTRAAAKMRILREYLRRRKLYEASKKDDAKASNAN